MTTYLTVTLLDKSWRSPGWKSCASFSPSFPQALRKTFRLSWAENKTRMRFVHLQRQRIISQEFSGRDAAYNSMLPKFISLEGRHGRGGACVQQIRAEHTQTAQAQTQAGGRGCCVTAADWQQQGYLWAGFWVESKSKPGSMTYTTVTQQMGRCEHKYDTRRNTTASHTLKLPLPMHAKPFHVNTCDICGAEDYFGDTGLLQNTRSGDEISFPEASRGGRAGTLCRKTFAVKKMFELEHVF